MTSSKEKCFEEAAKEYEDATGKDLGLKYQQPWRQNVDGSWTQEPRGFWAGVNSMRKWVMGNGHAGSAVQVRRPDLTVNDNTVVDLKFTRADGSKDNWGTRSGQGNGNTQKTDYNDINSQNNPDFDNDDPKIDADTCGCKGGQAEPARVGVPVTNPMGAPGLYFMPMPAPGVGIPVLPPVPSFGPLAPLPVPSSQRYKTDIQPAELKSERLLDLDVKTFRWRRDGRADVGLIAEEVNEKLPELYFEDADFAGIQAGHLPYYLLDLVQQQQKQIAELTEKISALEEKRTENQTDE
ncbi:MAG: tail fiber domain-containing protein [Pseudomonadota bacterium]